MLQSIYIVLFSYAMFLSFTLYGNDQAFNSLTKLTVGPFDNFAGVLNSSGDRLLYTQSKYLSTQIRMLNMESGLDKQLIAIDGDSKNPKISPDGKFIAFTYFINDAKGDVCFSPVEKLDINCFTKPNIADHSPTWVGDDKIILLSSDDFGEHSVLWSYNLKDQSKEILLKGDIFSPSVSMDRKKLIYRDGSNRLNVIDLQTRKKLSSYKLAAPIRMGQSFFGPRDEFIYFVGYVLDTNRDLSIDSRDNGVIYRFKVSAQKDRVVPTQLTSSAYNCSYPFVRESDLFLTCAFSGSLDIYKIQISGVIPQSWGEVDLWQAHKTSRSYHDRFILINHLFTNANAMNFNEHLKRSLFNLVLSNEWLAASAYAEVLSKQQEKLKSDYDAFSKLFSIYGKWQADQKRSEQGQMDKDLDRKIEELKKEQRKNAISLETKSILSAFYLFMSQHKEEAFLQLKNSKFKSIFHIYLQSYLIRLSYPDIDAYRNVLEENISDKNMIEENRVYYLSLYLDLASSVKDPVQFIERFLAKGGLEQEFIDVLENEIYIYKVTRTDDKKAQVKLAQSSSKIARKLKTSYIFKRLLFTRSMLIYQHAGLAKQQADLSSLWMSLSEKKSKEYPYVLEAFKDNTLENGYNFLEPQKNKLNYASGAFFAAIRSTDNLEAHFQYARLSLLKGASERFLNDYRLMLKDGLVTDKTMRFAELIRQLSFKQVALWPIDQIDEGIEALSDLPDNASGAGIKYLLLANIFHQKVLTSQKLYSYDRDAAEKSHRYYLLAIDLSRDNPRIVGAAHLNLGLLHYSIRNFTLAAEYLSYRTDYKFENFKKKLAFDWVYANCLYRAGRANDAYRVLEASLSIRHEASERYKEKAAFYAMAAGRYETATRLYLELAKDLGEQKMTGPMMLSLGFSLFKAGQDDHQASFWLKKAIDYADANGPKEVESAVVQNHAEKTRFIALGLLSQVESLSAQKRVGFLEKRLEFYKLFIEKADVYQFSSSELMGQHIKDLQRLATLQLSDKQFASSRRVMLESIRLCSVYGEDLGYLSYPVQQAFKNVVSFVLVEPNIDIGDFKETVDKVFNGMQAAKKEQKSLSDDVLLSYAKSTLLYNAFKASQFDLKTRISMFRKDSETYFSSESVQTLKAKNEPFFNHLEQYQKALLLKL